MAESLCVQMMALCFVLVLGSFSPCLSPLSLLTDASSSSRPSPPLPSADLYATAQGKVNPPENDSGSFCLTREKQSERHRSCVAVRSRSLLFFDEGSPLEESLAASEGERLQAEVHTRMQASRYTAEAHSNQTTGPKPDHM